MSHLLLTVALAAFAALPDHPLNKSIGGPRENIKPRNLDQVREGILQSRAFHQMVASSVRLAQDPRLAEDAQLKALHFGQRTRIILGRLFSDINYVEEWQPFAEGEAVANRPHSLDGVIGTTPRSADAVLKSLRESRAFAEIIRMAANEGEPLQGDNAGLNYGEAVRVLIGENLEGLPASDEETPQDTPTDDPAVTDDPAPIADTPLPTADDRQAFAQLDGNEDGVLSGTETRTVSKYDANGDGRITEAEFLAARASSRPSAPTPEDNALFVKLDGNEDGWLTGTEMKGLLRYDRDGDGEISKAEFLTGRLADRSNTTEDSPAATGIKAYRSEIDKLSPAHAEKFVPFTFSFPESWVFDPGAGTDNNSNSVKVMRDADLGGGIRYTQENFAVGSCQVSGGGELAKLGLQLLSQKFQEQVAKGFPEYKLNREGDMKFGKYDGYGFDFTSKLSHPKKDRVDCWGRVIMLAPGAIGQKHGLSIIMLGTSEAPELKSLADLGVKGELPVIINSFTIGDAPKPPAEAASEAPPFAPPTTPPPAT